MKAVWKQEPLKSQGGAWFQELDTPGWAIQSAMEPLGLASGTESISCRSCKELFPGSQRDQGTCPVAIWTSVLSFSQISCAVVGGNPPSLMNPFMVHLLRFMEGGWLPSKAGTIKHPPQLTTYKVLLKSVACSRGWRKPMLHIFRPCLFLHWIKLNIIIFGIIILRTKPDLVKGGYHFLSFPLKCTTGCWKLGVSARCLKCCLTGETLLLTEQNASKDSFQKSPFDLMSTCTVKGINNQHIKVRFHEALMVHNEKHTVLVPAHHTSGLSNHNLLHYV